MSFVPIPGDDEDGGGGGTETFTEPVHDAHDHTGIPGVGGGGTGTGFTEIDPGLWAFEPANPTAISILADNAIDSSIIQISSDAVLSLITSADASTATLTALGVGSAVQLSCPTGHIDLGSEDIFLVASDDILFTDSNGDYPLHNMKGFVNHGATAGTARPSGFASIEWYGSVEPSNAIDGDTWIDTSA